MAKKTFFQQQEAARKNTFLLIGYFVIAIALIIVAIYFVVSLAFYGAAEQEMLNAASPELWDPSRFFGVASATLIVIVMGSVYKILALSGGGKAVAKHLGGREVFPNTQDPQEKKLLNVVEEIAIASGTPVPPVFLLDHETAINAFAAGYSPGDAVIAASRGCMELLSRDELQGVMAHEFSHILNGDMRLNVRLIGVLNGILIIGLTGYWLLRSTYFSRGPRSRSSSDSRSTAGIFVLGLALFVIGYVGVFFGKLIKAAVSRQREFLADASAVQFTRNPDGIAGALKKIGGYAFGSRLETGKAEEASHMFFANGIASSFFNLLATHPPLAERVERIDPSFSGIFKPLKYEEILEQQSAETVQQAAAAKPKNVTDRFILTPDKITDMVGNPQPEHLLYAISMLGGLSPMINERAHDPSGARALIYTLLLDAKQEIKDRQLKHLAQFAEDQTYQDVIRLQQEVGNLRREQYLSLIDLSIPSLKLLTPRQYEVFRMNVDKLINADEKCSLFEFALQQVLIRHLDPHFLESEVAARKSFTKKAVHAATTDLLATLAYLGNSDTVTRTVAFDRALKTLNPNATLEYDGSKQYTVQIAQDALEIIATVPPKAKQVFIEACTACVATDNYVSIEEAELLRAIGDALDCPIPPFLPGAMNG